MQEASNISMTISTGEYRLDLQPLGNRRRHALQLRGCIPQLEYSSAMVRLLRTADEKELFSNKELKDFLWQTMIDTETGANKLKGMLPAKTVVGHKTGSSDRNADGMKLQIMMPASLSFPTAGNTTLPPSSWTHTRRMRTMNIIARISRMVYDAMR